MVRYTRCHNVPCKWTLPFTTGGILGNDGNGILAIQSVSSRFRTNRRNTCVLSLLSQWLKWGEPLTRCVVAPAVHNVLRHPPGFAIAQSYLIKGIKWGGFPWHHIVSILCSVGEMGWAPIDRGVNGEGREVSWHICTLMIQISKSSPKVVLFKVITLYKVDEIKNYYPSGDHFLPTSVWGFLQPRKLSN